MTEYMQLVEEGYVKAKRCYELSVKNNSEIPLAGLLVGGGNLTVTSSSCFSNGEHNYQAVIDAIYKYQADNPSLDVLAVYERALNRIKMIKPDLWIKLSDYNCKCKKEYYI